MAGVPEKVLSWLSSVLREYRDSRRTYSDVARTLSAYQSLSPRTEVYTYENGASALLLTLSGTLPVAFRGMTYHFPVKLWIPQSYPQDAPMVFVEPSKNMLIRPGQHVGADGRVYHPYIRDWSRMWDRASLAELINFLQQVFAKEPPVISKVQLHQYQTPSALPQAQPAANASPAPPRPPPKQRVGENESVQTGSAHSPPPKPPKPGVDSTLGQRVPTLSRNPAIDGPPLPPLPHELQAQQVTDYSHLQNGLSASAQVSLQTAHSRPFVSQESRGPGPRLPPLPQQLHYHHSTTTTPQQKLENALNSPASPVSPLNGYSELPESKYSQSPPLPQQPHHQSLPPQAAPQQHNLQQQPVQYFHERHVTALQPLDKVQPPPDLLSDPFEVALPVLSGPPAPAPPIPPNPEKEHLLHALSTSFVRQAQQRVHQNLSAVASLQAQHNALWAAHARLEAETRQLEQLSKTLDSNEAILRRSIQDCDATIANAKRKKQPQIDEVLIAPTMVANQLWTLCAEEASCREAMYVLQKAVDRGRVSAEVFVRQMRGLGREEFLKMALARKCARGLGLDVDRR